MLPKNFCIQPWNGLFLKQNGLMWPCCKFRHDLDENFKDYYIQSNTLKEFKDSKFIKELQKQFLNGERPKACDSCWKDEDAGFLSTRQLRNERWEQEFNDYDMSSGDIQVISIPVGNLCNLKCRICNPYNSSTFIKEWLDLYGKDHPRESWFENDAVWQKLIDISKDALEIHMHGGEPFVLDHAQHNNFLSKLIERGYAKHIRLHYSTNMTRWPSDGIIESWKSFKHVDLQASIDDIKHRFEYNRHPAKWDLAEINLFKAKEMVNQLSNFQLSIAITVTAFTIYYLPEMFEYYFKNNFPKPWLGRLHDPKPYQPNVFPKPIAEKIRAKLLASPSADVRKTASWVNEKNDHLFPNFQEKVKIHDEYRKESFDRTFPELVDLFYNGQPVKFSI